jgi:hypothetical protein
MVIEIFEEDGDHTLSFDNEHADFTIDVDPESKTYRSRMRLKDDVYYRTQRYEYRIQTNPIKVESRLVERKDEPPEQYCVKDGVVLESDILKERGDFMTSMTKEFIDGLKKEVEWHEDWRGDVVSMYLLSKHPDIVSPDDYRRYLRQLSEQIKNGNQKVEKAVESDSMGLKVTDEYEGSGRTIWLSRAEQDKLSEDESTKAIEHQRKVQERLFDEKSKEYVGITQGEFSSSVDMLENIETFLNKKPATAKKQEDQKVSFGIKLAAFIFQWVWLFIVVSIALWLLSLIVTIIQYDATFAFFASGILAFFFVLLRKK